MTVQVDGKLKEVDAAGICTRTWAFDLRRSPDAITLHLKLGSLTVRSTENGYISYNEEMGRDLDWGQLRQTIQPLDSSR